MKAWKFIFIIVQLKERRVSIHFSNKRGIALVASIFLSVFASIAVLSVTTFIVQRVYLQEAASYNIKALYNASAGIQEAIYRYQVQDRSGVGYFILGQTNIDADSYFVLDGDAADLLMVDTANAALDTKKFRDIKNLRIQNATQSKTIAIDGMLVTWDNAASIRRIKIGGTVLWRGQESSPASIVIDPPLVLDTVPTSYLVNFIRFNSDMTGATVSIQFQLADGTNKDVVVFPASAVNNFLVKSTGKVSGASVFRTIEAEYNARTQTIVKYKEIDSQNIP